MSVKIRCEYQGDLNIQCEHGPSHSIIKTTAPVDNGGKGDLFSPTDLFSTSLGSCILTVMGIVAERHQIDLKGSYTDITKIMQANPRRVGELQLIIHLPSTLTEKDRKLMETTAAGCPVKQSLHPDIILNLTYIYDL